MTRPGRPPTVQTIRTQRRQRAGLTQADAARAAGRSTRAVRLWERGQRDDPTIDGVVSRHLTADLWPDLVA